MTNKIIVGMDISQMAHVGGVATYTKELASELSKIEELEMRYFYSSLRKPLKTNLRNVKRYRLPPTLFEILFNKIRNVSIEKFLGPLDIFHSSDWTQPPSKAKRVTTYHDVVPLKYPQWSDPKIVAVHKRRLQLVEKEVDMVIAVSESTKKDLLEISNIPEEKIVIIYEASAFSISDSVRYQGDALVSDRIKRFKEKYNLPDRFILAIGGIGERRNLKRIKEASKNYHLVITGQTIPWLELDELELLYSSASVLVYCSLYEGFGIPILDAFSIGCPVITSNVSSMSEVGGNAAEYVNPQSVDDIRNKLKEVMEDKQKRETIIKKGFLQSKKFSWEKAAKETAAVYKNLLP